MINQNIATTFIKNLSPSSAKKCAARLGIFFNEYEINILLPYLQKNCNQLLNEKNRKEKIHIDLKNIINMDSINKLILLLSKLGYN